MYYYLITQLITNSNGGALFWFYLIATSKSENQYKCRAIKL